MEKIIMEKIDTTIQFLRHNDIEVQQCFSPCFLINKNYDVILRDSGYETLDCLQVRTYKTIINKFCDETVNNEILKTFNGIKAQVKTKTYFYLYETRIEKFMDMDSYKEKYGICVRFSYYRPFEKDKM